MEFNLRWKVCKFILFGWSFPKIWLIIDLSKWNLMNYSTPMLPFILSYLYQNYKIYILFQLSFFFYNILSYDRNLNVMFFVLVVSISKVIILKNINTYYLIYTFITTNIWKVKINFIILKATSSFDWFGLPSLYIYYFLLNQYQHIFFYHSSNRSILKLNRYMLILKRIYENLKFK